MGIRMLQMAISSGAFFDQPTFLLLHIDRLAAILARNAYAIIFMIVKVGQCTGFIAAHLGIDGEQSSAQVETTRTGYRKSFEIGAIIKGI